jgi:glycosyltransferase involved in cell wall biosynthesis
MSKSGPKISVVMPAYNAQDFLREAIDSVVGQEGADFEFILVDDGSTDATAEIARSYGEALVYHHRDNGGVAEALNTGIGLARGEYIALMGADDVLKPGSLATRVAALDCYPTAAFVHGGAFEIDEKGTVLGARGELTGEPGLEPSAQAFRRLLNGNHVVCSTTMARREHLLATGGFNQAFMPGEDWAMLLQLAAHGDVAYVPAHLADYRIHSASLVGRLPMGAYEAAHERVLSALFGEEAPEELRSHRDQAYAAHHRRMALTAAYLRDRRRFLPHFLRSLRMRPAFVLEGATWKTAYFGARLLLPERLLQALGRIKRTVRPRAVSRGAGPHSCPDEGGLTAISRRH